MRTTKNAKNKAWRFKRSGHRELCVNWTLYLRNNLRAMMQVMKATQIMHVINMTRFLLQETCLTNQDSWHIGSVLIPIIYVPDVGFLHWNERYV